MAKGKFMTLNEELLGNAKKEMKQLCKKVKQRPLTCIVCFLIIVFVIYLLFVLPYQQVAKFGITNPKDLADAVNNYRATIAQILGGIAVGTGIYFAWGNLTNAREGQITERFTRAVDQLGNQAMEIKLGGIYALERISKESEKDFLPIMEIFNSYINKNSPKCIQYFFVEVNERHEIMDQFQLLEYSSKEIGKIKNHQDFSKFSLYLSNNIFNYRRLEVKPDIMAITSVITRLTIFYQGHVNNELYTFDFEGTNLQAANFEKAHLEKSTFILSSLLDINFKGAYLKEAGFGGAILIEANLEDSHLESVSFYYSNLKKACLKSADLTRADLKFAIFKDADLKFAIFKDANLEGADFRKADLRGAKSLTFDQLSKVKTLYNAKLDPEREEELRSEGFGKLIDDEPER